MTPNLYDINSAEGVRQIGAALFQGYNYRLYPEGQTRNQLFDSDQQLIQVRHRLLADAGYAEWLSGQRIAGQFICRQSVAQLTLYSNREALNGNRGFHQRFSPHCS